MSMITELVEHIERIRKANILYKENQDILDFREASLNSFIALKEMLITPEFLLAVNYLKQLIDDKDFPSDDKDFPSKELENILKDIGFTQESIKNLKEKKKIFLNCQMQQQNGIIYFLHEFLKKFQEFPRILLDPSDDGEKDLTHEWIEDSLIALECCTVILLNASPLGSMLDPKGLALSSVICKKLISSAFTKLEKKLKLVVLGPTPLSTGPGIRVTKNAVFIGAIKLARRT